MVSTDELIARASAGLEEMPAGIGFLSQTRQKPE
jgi:hypothetical protein